MERAIKKPIALPPIVSPAEWQAAREVLLVKEKAATRARGALPAERRRQPMVKIDKAYAFAAAIAMMGAGPAVADGNVPVQAHPISECRNLPDKRSCLTAYWSEYKAAIIIEYDRWKALLPSAISGSDLVASKALGEAMNGGWYVHNDWEFGALEPDEFDQIPVKEFEAIYDCRAAIINMKFWLVAITSPEGPAPSDPSDFKSSSERCEQSGLASRQTASTTGSLTDQIQQLLEDPTDSTQGVAVDWGEQYGHDIEVQYTDQENASKAAQISTAAKVALRIGQLVLDKHLSPPGKSILIKMALKSSTIGLIDTFTVRFAWSDVLRIAKTHVKTLGLGGRGQIEAIWYEYWPTICTNPPPPERFAGGDGPPEAAQDIDNPTGKDISCHLRQ